MCPTDSAAEVQGENKTIAWNRISLTVPGTWEVDGLDIDHMLIGDETGSRFEVRWGRVSPDRSLDFLVARFIKRAKKKLAVTMALSRDKEMLKLLPDTMAGIEFSWNGQGRSGMGVFLFCRYCGCFSVFRFFSGLEYDAKTLAAILTSFRDHDDRGRTSWCVFGLDAGLDSRFLIRTFRFQPGAFELRFETGLGVRLALSGWGPASVLLSGSDLKDFARSVFNDLPEESAMKSDGTMDFFEWVMPGKQPFLSRLTGTVPGRKPAHCVTRVIHDRMKNRIHGVKLAFPGSVEPGIITELSHVRF